MELFEFLKEKIFCLKIMVGLRYSLKKLQKLLL